MSAVVGGFLVPHAPSVIAAPDLPSAADRDAVMDAYAAVAERFAALEPTTIVVVGTDHYVLFGPSCLPQMLLATGDIEGPIERLPGVPREPLPANEALAEHLRASATAEGFDLAVARSLTVDHSIMVPYHLIARPFGPVPLVPVYLACGVEPYVPLRRAAELGAALGRAVAAHDGDERVVVIGSGGISHSVGTARMGEINEDFDRRILDIVERGAVDELTAMSDETLLAEGGNGALEMRIFACALAAVGGTGEVVSYTAVPEWVTGMGFAQLFPAVPVPA